MSATPAIAAPRHDTPLKNILTAGLVAGVLDDLDAAIFRQRSITIGLAIFFQLFIATGAAAAYYAITRMFPTILSKPILFGTIFGLAVFFIMHYIVVPLSGVPGHSRTGFAD